MPTCTTADPVSAAEQAQQLFEGNRRLAYSIANHYRRQARDAHVPFEAIEQEALVGLWIAAQRFDPARGVAFSSFAVPHIRGHIVKGIQRERPWLSLPVDADGQTIEPAAPEAHEPDMDTQDQVADLLGCLPGIEGKVVRSYYGLQGEPRLTRREIGLRLGVCPTRVAEILDAARERMRRHVDREAAP